MAKKKPKLTSSTFLLKTNTYAIETNGVFQYYSIKVIDDPAKDVLSFSVRPPVHIAGLVTIKRVTYKVSVRDLLRGVIRKSSVLKSTVNERASKPIRRKPSSKNSIVSPSSCTNSGVDEQRPLPDVVLEVCEDANATWSEQTTALLETLHTKEGGDWEITGST